MALQFREVLKPFAGPAAAGAATAATEHICSRPPLFTGAMSAYPYDPGLEAAYRFKTSFGDIVPMAVRNGNLLLVPRETCPKAEAPFDHRVRYEPLAINCNFTPANHEQQPLANESIALLKAGHNHLFDAPTGWGKSVVGSYIAVQMGQPTMITVTKQDLLHQWHNALTGVLGIPRHLVGQVQGDVCEWEGRRFVIGMVQSLIIPDRYPPEMYRYFGMLLCDEAHMMAADCFVRACQMFPAYYRLGFSATEKRRDGKSKLLYAHIGSVRVRGHIVPMKPKVLIRQTGWKIPEVRVKVVNAYEYKKIPHAPGRMGLVTKAMGGSLKRNQEILQFVTQAFQAGRRILVLSDLIENHLDKLFYLFTSNGISGEEIGFYVGGKKKSELDMAKKRRVVLGTYAMCSTGTDVPQWDSLVLATPRANVKQSIGRVMRMMEGKKQPVILDLLDADPIFHAFHKTRLQQYFEVGAELVQVA